MKSSFTSIKAHRSVASEYFLITISGKDIARSARPGQFVMVSVPYSTDPFLGRPFAIYDVGDDGTVQILFKRVGKGTTMLSRLRPGDVLRVVGPLGRGFALSDGTEEVIVVAGGAGIASVRFLLRRCLERGIRSSLLYGARKGEELICVRDLEAMGLRTYLCTDDGTCGYKGQVTDLLASFLVDVRISDELTPYAFVCGPHAMAASVVRMLAAAGIRGQCSLESVMACGYGVCQGCVVKTRKQGTDLIEYARVCTEGPVFSFDDIVWE